MARTIKICGIICGSEMENEFTAPYIERGIITPLSTFLRQIDEADGEDLEIYINSQGGSVDSGMEMLNRIQDYKGKVKIVVGALAASMAAEITLLAGKRVEVHNNTRLMFHSAYGCVEGGPEALKDYVKELEILNKPAMERLIKLGVPKEDVEEGFSEGRMFWMGAEEALSYGIAHKILDGSDDYTYRPNEDEVQALAKQSARMAAYAELTEETTMDKTDDTAPVAETEVKAEVEAPAVEETTVETKAEAETTEVSAEAETVNETAESAPVVEEKKEEEPKAEEPAKEEPKEEVSAPVITDEMKALMEKAEHSEENARKIQASASKKIDALNKQIEDLNKGAEAFLSEKNDLLGKISALEESIKSKDEELKAYGDFKAQYEEKVLALETENKDLKSRLETVKTKTASIVGNVVKDEGEECSDWLTAVRRYGIDKAIKLHPDLARDFRVAMAGRKKNK